MTKKEVLQLISFGERVAEEETEFLSTYFVETDQWSRLYQGSVDIVYGPKGSGKSALYSLLNSNTERLFERNTLIITGENPRGATAFQNLNTSPPSSETEFVNLWKLYFLTLLQSKLSDYEIDNASARELEKALAEEGLIKGKLSLAGVLTTVAGYIKKYFNPSAVEGQLSVDPISQSTTATGRIVFSEPTNDKDRGEKYSVDHLFGIADNALKKEGFCVWILLDRLDVAFAENQELEKNALRALFRVYLDLQAFSNVKLKIFLRTDIWKNITDEGFREASHITKHLTITWNRSSLLNLIVRRAIHNAAITSYYGISADIAKMSMEEQETFFYKVFPNQVEVGPNKPNTVDWLLSRTRDGSKQNAPRELIHFLNVLREVQVKKFEVGEVESEDEQLFVRPAFKDALPEVSRVRLEQTLYPEYPTLKPHIEQLKGAKTLHSRESLSAIWQSEPDVTAQRANDLVSVGFFEQRGTTQAPEFWTPFLYRDALDMVQGAADL